MKKKRFSVEQIVGVLKQAEVGVPIGELVRQEGISEQTFYRWKNQYVGLEIDQVRQLKQLQEENQRLKRLVADLTLDKMMLQDVLAKNSEASATPSGGPVPARGLRGERTARLCRDSVEPRDIPISEPPGSAHGAADEDVGDRRGAGAVRMSQDTGAAAAGRLASGQVAGEAIVSGRRADAAADGRRFRALTVVDVYTRESLAIGAGQSPGGADAARVRLSGRS